MTGIPAQPVPGGMSSTVNDNDVYYLNVTYSNLAGEYALKSDRTQKYMTNLRGKLTMQSSMLPPQSKWLFEYSGYGHYTIRSQSEQDKYLIRGDYGYGTAELGDTESGEADWYYDTNDKLLISFRNESLALGSDFELHDLELAETWTLTNYVNYIDVTDIYMTYSGSTHKIKSILEKQGGYIEYQVIFVPSNATYKQAKISTPSFVFCDDSCESLSFEAAGQGMIYTSYKYNAWVGTSFPVIVGTGNPNTHLDNMVFNFKMSFSGGIKYLTNNNGSLTCSANSIHSSTNSTLDIKKPDDHNVQFYVQRTTSDPDLYTICFVGAPAKYIAASPGGSVSLSSTSSSYSHWRIIELADGSYGIWNPATTLFLTVGGNGAVTAGAGLSNTHWTLNIAGVYKLTNVYSGKVMTVEGGYDTDLQNGDNKMTVNIITQNQNAANSEYNLDSNQLFRIVYKDDIGGYLLYPICSMNGSRRIIGRNVSGAGGVILLNYSSAVIDKVDISSVSDLSGGQFVIKTQSGNLAMTDSYNNVSFAAYVTGSANQQWVLTPDTVRMQNEIKFSSLDIEYPLSNGSTIITSGYGMRIYGAHQFHSGLDISATLNTPLYAVFDGEIIDKSDTPSGDRGRYITIRSNNLYYNNVSVTIIVNYYHLQSVTELGVGDTVTANVFIGRVGGSGYNQDNAYSPHLHITFSTDYNEQGRYVEQSDTFNPLWIYRDKIFGSNSTTDEIPGVIE